MNNKYSIKLDHLIANLPSSSPRSVDLPSEDCVDIAEVADSTPVPLTIPQNLIVHLTCDTHVV